MLNRAAPGAFKNLTDKRLATEGKAQALEALTNIGIVNIASNADASACNQFGVEGETDAQITTEAGPEGCLKLNLLRWFDCGSSLNDRGAPLNLETHKPSKLTKNLCKKRGPLLDDGGHCGAHFGLVQNALRLDRSKKDARALSCFF